MVEGHVFFYPLPKHGDVLPNKVFAGSLDKMRIISQVSMEENVDFEGASRRQIGLCAAPGNARVT